MFDRKAEPLYALDQLRSLRVTLPEVVTSYVRHHHTNGNPTMSELVELFFAEKKRIGRSNHDERSLRYYLNGSIGHIGQDVRHFDAS